MQLPGAPEAPDGGMGGGGESLPLASLPPAPSASSLELELPLSPVVALPIEPSNINSSQPFGGDGAAAGALSAAESDVPTSPLRSGSSRNHLLQSLKRPATEVWVFGRGDMGQLGDGSTEDVFVPRLVKGLKSRDVVNLAAGALHTAAVTCEPPPDSPGRCHPWWLCVIMARATCLLLQPVSCALLPSSLSPCPSCCDAVDCIFPPAESSRPAVPRPAVQPTASCT